MEEKDVQGRKEEEYEVRRARRENTAKCQCNTPGAYVQATVSEQQKHARARKARSSGIHLTTKILSSFMSCKWPAGQLCTA